MSTVHKHIETKWFFFDEQKFNFDGSDEFAY